MPRRGRPLDEARTPAILTATLDLVADVGIAKLTVEGVAKRAGVGKATIYRRWPTKEALMLDAWATCLKPAEAADTGSLRGDLGQMFLSLDKRSPDVDLRRVFPQMVAAAKVEPDVAEAYRRFVADRRVPLMTVLVRGVARGELPAGVDLELVLDLLVAPIMYRWLVTDGPIDDDVIVHLIDIVLAGATVPSTIG